MKNLIKMLLYIIVLSFYSTIILGLILMAFGIYFEDCCLWISKIFNNEATVKRSELIDFYLWTENQVGFNTTREEVELITDMYLKSINAAKRN